MKCLAPSLIFLLIQSGCVHENYNKNQIKTIDLTLEFKSTDEKNLNELKLFNNSIYDICFTNDIIKNEFSSYIFINGNRPNGTMPAPIAGFYKLHNNNTLSFKHKFENVDNIYLTNRNYISFDAYICDTLERVLIKSAVIQADPR